MLLKYRNSAVQAVSISQTLTKIPALEDKKNAIEAERHVMRNDRVEESALINFFRQVVTKRPPEENVNQCGVIVPIRQTARKTDMRQAMAASPQSIKNLCNLRQATNELLARLRNETKTPDDVSPKPVKKTTAAIYKYRSKASITHNDLPALVVNQ